MCECVVVSRLTASSPAAVRHPQDGPRVAHLAVRGCAPLFAPAKGKAQSCLSLPSPQDEFKAFQVCLQKNPEHLAKIMAADEVAAAAEQAAADGGSREPGAAAAAGQPAAN